MNSWERDIYLRNSELSKALNGEDTMDASDFSFFLKSNNLEIVTDIEKAKKDLSRLIKKEVWVERDGRRFKQTVYVKPSTEESRTAEVGEEISPSILGMEIKRYTDKSILITGETKENLETLREIKKETGTGKWISKLKGWVFPHSQSDTVLGILWSKLKDKGDDLEASAVQNKKNAVLEKGDTAKMGDEQIKVTDEVSDEEGIKYNAVSAEGVKLEKVNEKVLQKEPEKDDSKISKVINNAKPENRVASEKILFGIRPINDVHKFTLNEYLCLHGISKTDIEAAIKRLTGKGGSGEGTGKPRTRTSSGGSKPSDTEELTKRRLISKLIFAHYRAVKEAVQAGKEVPENVLAVYKDLQEAYQKKVRGPLSEEHKRKIAEALRKEKVPENESDDVKKMAGEVEEVSDEPKIDKENYAPLEGPDITILGNAQYPNPGSVKTKDFRNVPAIDVLLPADRNILTAEKPYFIPDVDPAYFKRQGYSLPAVKLEDDKYLVPLNSFTSGSGYFAYSPNIINKNANYAIMSLDVYAATSQYHLKKAKAQHKKEQDEYAERARKRLLESGYFKTEKEAAKYKPARKRLKVLGENRMTYDHSFLYHAFSPVSNDKRERNWTWRQHRELVGARKQKASDLDLQYEANMSSYDKGAETSYGDSGTKNNLLKEYGIKVKRQNGDVINESEINQVKNAMDSLEQVFGKNLKMNKEFGLKISHSGSKLMHARKAVGLFIPYYNAIGVSAKYGETQFKMTAGHEYAHFMDYWVGKKTGNNFASDKQGSTANRIASQFRRNMNETSSSAYTNRTCEAFARAMEQYHAVEVWNDKSLFSTPDQVNESVYKNQIKPLIEKFLTENREILKSLFERLNLLK